MERGRFSLLLYRTALLGSLLGWTATIYFLFGIGGHLGNPVLDLAAALMVLMAALFFLYAFFFVLLDRSRIGLLLWLLILLILGIEALLGLVPPAVRDEVVHHLALPKLYIKAGRIYEVPFALHSYYPMLIDMLYTPFVGWGLDALPKLIHGLYGLLTGLVIFAYLAWRLNSIYGLLGFLFFISTPVVLKLGNLAYVDLGLTFYCTASLLCLLRWVEESKTKGWLFLSAFSAGFALASKPSGLLVFLLLFFLLVFILESMAQGKALATAAWASLFSLLALIPFSPWLLKNFTLTGNPLFPFFTTLLGGQAQGIFSVAPLSIRRVLYGESWWQIAALPLRVFFFGQDNQPQYFDGVLNPVLILFLPWAFKGKWPAEKRVFFAFALLFFLFALFMTDLRIRYLLPLVPALVILAVFGVHNLYLRLAHPPWLFVAVIFLLAWNGLYLSSYFREVSPLAYLGGGQGREAYLQRRLVEFPAIQYINRNLPSEARVFLLFTGNRGYYLERDYFYDTGDLGQTLLRVVGAADDEREIAQGFKKEKITHLLVRQELLQRFVGRNFTPAQREIWRRFQGRYLEPLFEQRGYGVYAVRASG